MADGLPPVKVAAYGGPTFEVKRRTPEEEHADMLAMLRNAGRTADLYGLAGLIAECNKWRPWCDGIMAERDAALEVVAAAVEARNALAALMESVDVTRPGMDLSMTEAAKRQRAAYLALWAAVDEWKERHGTVEG